MSLGAALVKDRDRRGDAPSDGRSAGMRAPPRRGGEPTNQSMAIRGPSMGSMGSMGSTGRMAPGSASNHTTDKKAEPEDVVPHNFDFSDMRKFNMTPPPRTAGTVQCYIERKKSGMKKWAPEYYLHLKDGQRFLLVAKKRTVNRTSNYSVACNQSGLTSRKSTSFLGKVRSNFVGTEFTAYDAGVNPKDTDQGSYAGVDIRKEYALMQYASNVLGSKGPRKMKVVVPAVNKKTNKAIVFKPSRKSEGLQSRVNQGNAADSFYLMNKPPRWSEHVGAYVLNFNGRVTMASVKNFQLVSPDDHDTIILQFGRTGKNKFTIDYRWPLTSFQAFSICLSSFDYKLACE